MGGCNGYAGLMYQYPPELYLSPGIDRQRPSPQRLGEAMVRAIADGELEERNPPVEHLFASGLYGRRIKCEAGTVVVTMRHKSQHITIALVGTCVVSDESGRRMRVSAPGWWVTEPGTQRSVLCETDVEWITVHANPDEVTDPDVIEDILAEDTLSDIKRHLLCHGVEQ